MSSTASHIQADQGCELFYYLKITGIPYYFMSVINPADATRYGTLAWTLPAGYTAVQGMDVPTDALDQSVPDLLGGIASAERLRITLRDFDAFDSAGRFSYIARLFAPGRLALTNPLPEISTNIAVKDGLAGTFGITGGGAGATIGSGAAWVANIGDEALSIDAAVVMDANGAGTLGVNVRNLYPCNANYPAPPYHNVMVDATGAAIAGRAPLVTTEPYTLLGRSAALYIGHMEPNGMPCLESETLCRLIGRITNMDYGQTGGEFTITVDSVMAEVASAQLAPCLAASEIYPEQLVVQGNYRYLTLSIGEADVAFDAARMIIEVAVDAGTYYIGSLVTEINRQFLANPGSGANSNRQIRCQIQTIGGVQRVGFFMFHDGLINSGQTSYSSTATVWIRNGRLVKHIDSYTTEGLMSVLGFNPKDTYKSETVPINTLDVLAASGDTRQMESVVSENLPPTLFIPFDDAGATFAVKGDVNRFFTDQGDNANGTAYVRFPDNRIVELKSVTPGSPYGSLTTGAEAPANLSSRKGGVAYGNFSGDWGYFRVDRGVTSSIEQVLALPVDPKSRTSAGVTVGRLLASTGLQSGGFDLYPQGVGLGLNGILDTDSFQRLPDDTIPRQTIVDNKSTFGDFFKPLATTYGWFMVWDPLVSQIRLRQVRVPSAPRASDIVLSESNRASTGDLTGSSIDRSSMRSGWTLKWGYDRFQDKFIGDPFTLSDSWVLSSSRTSVKVENIEDKTLVRGSGDFSAAAIVLQLLERSYLYRQPWMKGHRTISKAGLLIAPGSAHLLVDNTTINPFTGNAGITAADALYVLVTKSSCDLVGRGEIEYVINRQDPSGTFRSVAPCALLDYAATGHGYDTATGIVTLVSHYASDGVSYDGIDFLVGDLVTLFTRDADGTPAYEHQSTIAAVAVDGHTVTVASGLGTSAGELVMALQDYTTQPAARKLSVAYQGRVDGKIQTITPNNKWL